jgi:hypothetical protein
MALLAQPILQQRRFEIAAAALFPVADTGIAELPEQPEQALLGGDFTLADGAHSRFPVTRICETDTSARRVMSIPPR